jgi:hypothetical protein
LKHEVQSCKQQLKTAEDTHPAMAVAELMYILLDQARLAWDEAWDLTVLTLEGGNPSILKMKTRQRSGAGQLASRNFVGCLKSGRVRRRLAAQKGDTVRDRSPESV